MGWCEVWFTWIMTYNPTLNGDISNYDIIIGKLLGLDFVFIIKGCMVNT